VLLRNLSCSCQRSLRCSQAPKRLHRGKLGRSNAAPLRQTAEGGGKIGDGVEEEVGFGGAEAGFGGEGAEDGDAADSGSAGHFKIFGRIADINTGGGIQGHLPQGETQRGRMRLAVACVSAADVRREEISELEEAQLAHDAVAVAAGDDSELVLRAEMLQDTAGAGH
jgi:hypothetical protein